MICFMCKGTLQDGFSNFTADMDNERAADPDRKPNTRNLRLPANTCKI